MLATRARLAPLLEWLCAAAIIVALLAVGMLAVREGRVVRAATPVMANEAPAPEPPPSLPPRAISLPMLLLSDGKVVQIGAAASDVLAQLGRWAQVGADSIDRAAGVERITRFYQYVGTRFALVFEAPRQNGEPRVIAIYRE
jgi:hypothetical protein